MSLQWGSFGVRLVVDGVPVVGSSDQWYQGPQDFNMATIGNGWAASVNGFWGYIDDFKVWPCSYHGTLTPTITPTITQTQTYVSPTTTQTWTTTPTLTITCTGTELLTPTISPTRTVSPIPSLLKLIGIFPNPGTKNIRLVFSSDTACMSILTIYTVSGEKVNTIKTPAAPGMNAILINAGNSGGAGLASGAYICGLELQFPEDRKKYFWSRFAVLK
jgi:hypothetical protein